MVQFWNSESPPASFCYRYNPDEELDRQIDIDRQHISLGVPLTLGYFYKRYKRPAPSEGERVLRFDDNNLYQYHLQYVVLTINEVRAAIGLKPVSWGDQRFTPNRAQGEIREALDLSQADTHIEERYPEMSELNKRES